jgi:tubulin delta
MPDSAIVTLQLGQCGNQLGHEMFATLAREAAAHDGGSAGGKPGGVGGSGSGGGAPVDELLPQYFRRGKRGQQAAGGSASVEGGLDDGSAVPIARSVLVDMEPKVIWQVVERASRSREPGRWRYQPGGSFAQASGAGNNWAYGFAVHGPAASDTVMELVRKEVEHCDRLGGLMLLQSLAGGTGSGVGTYLTETLRDHYPHANLLNHTVWPYESGEVIVQHYNAMLTLAKVRSGRHSAVSRRFFTPILQYHSVGTCDRYICICVQVVELADATLYSENEQLDNLCRRMLNLPKPTFDHLNQAIASQLAHLCLPVRSYATQSLPA